MTGTNILTAGDGKLHRLSEKGYSQPASPQREVYQITLMCCAATLQGVANANGIAIGVDGELIVWLAIGDSITLLTRDLGAVCWQDASGAASVLGIVIEMPIAYVVNISEN